MLLGFFFSFMFVFNIFVWDVKFANMVKTCGLFENILANNLNLKFKSFQLLPEILKAKKDHIQVVRKINYENFANRDISVFSIDKFIA